VSTMSKWWSLVAVCLGTFMLLIDVTIVNVALPAIERDLDASFSDLQWVVDAYALTLASALLIGGSIADIVGRRKVFMIGVAVFSAASLLCGLSTTPLMLNLARGLQGVGGALMFATSLALLASAYQGRDRGTAIGIWGATIGGAVAIGPLLGGVLTEAIGWEAIFFVNVPVGVGVIALTLRNVPESRNPQGGAIDYPGLVTFSASLFLLVFSLIRGNTEGWGSTMIVSMLVASVVLMAAFLVVESRSKDPMLELSLFRKPAFDGASIAAFVLSAAMFSMFLYLTLYIQNQLGYSALESGLSFLPVTLLSFAVAPLAGKFAERIGVRYFFGAGLGLIGIGLILMAGLDASDDWTALLPGFILAGVGVGLTNPALATAAVGVVPPQRAGMASGINSTFRQVGIATGIAAWGAVFQHLVNGQAQAFSAAVGRSGPPAGASGSFSDFISFGIYHRLGPNATAPGREAFLHGLNHILVYAAIVAFIGAVASALLTRPQDFVAHGGQPSPPQQVEAVSA
jgi:EmrB/QacA subfamily drug resistance transporter